MTQQVGVPVRYVVPQECTMHGARGVTQRTSRLQGFVRLAGAHLVLEWCGAVDVCEIARGQAAMRTEAIPVTSVRVPVERIEAMEQRGGWWRPRLVLRARDLSAFQGVPGAVGARLVLRISRRDRTLAAALASVLKMEMADAAIRAAEGLPALPGAAVDEVRAARETDALAAGPSRGGERATRGGAHG